MPREKWTAETLKQYLDSHLDAIHEELNCRVAELHREHDKFERTTQEGFVKQNEFRGSLEDLGKQMATRREIETLEETLNKRLYRIENNQARIAGGLLIIGILLPLAAVIIAHLLP